MEDLDRLEGIGSRIRAVRKSRGIKSTADLAALVSGDKISGAVLRNIEAGVKTDVAVSELLNISRALNVSPVFLLAPMRTPDVPLDLPNLSASFAGMTAIEFDDWLSGGSDVVRDWTTPADQSERNQLRAMRELERASLEKDRLSRLIESANGSDFKIAIPEMAQEIESYAARKAESARHIERLCKYLEAAGWDVGRWMQ
jgi:transcriptional regulator with XRE-family HTH domain